MRVAKSAAALAVVFWLAAGCIPSLYPWFSEKDVVFEEALLGTFAGEADNGVWKFAKAEADKRYSLSITDKDGKTGDFDATLARFGGITLLDLYPQDPKGLSPFYVWHLQPCHTFLLVEKMGDELTLRPMNPSWLQKHLKENPDAIAHHTDKERLLLTAPTDKLQAFIVRHLKTEGAWGDAVGLRRQ